MALANSSDTCNSGSLQWASLIIAFISVNLTWWVLDIPKIWKDNFKHYLKCICWNCLRVTFPGVACVYAFRNASSVNGPALQIYYFGIQSTEQPRSRMTGLEYAKVLASDSLTVIGTIISVYKACTLPLNEDGDLDRGQWNVAAQVFPILPAAVLGFWLIIIHSIKWRTNSSLTGLLILGSAFVAMALPCVAFTLILVYASPLRKGDLWVSAMMSYIYQAIPFSLIFPGLLWFLLLCAAASFLARTGNVGISALTASQFAPLCNGSHQVFGGFYLAFGVSAALLAFYGYFAFSTIPRNLSSPSSRGQNQQQSCDRSAEAIHVEETMPMTQDQIPDNSKTLPQIHVNDISRPHLQRTVDQEHTPPNTNKPNIMSVENVHRSRFSEAKYGIQSQDYDPDPNKITIDNMSKAEYLGTQMHAPEHSAGSMRS